MRRSNFPFRQGYLPTWYGILVLLLGTIGVVMSVPGQTMGVSVFTDHLIEALGLSRDQLSLAYMFGTLTSSLIITRAGKLYDRYGARMIGVVTSVMLAVALIYMISLSNLAPSIKHSWVIFLLTVLGFFGMRFFGQGVLTMVSRNMVMKWYDKIRGLANSILGAVTALGFSVAPAVFSVLIDDKGWQGAWWIIAAIVGLGFATVVFLFFRDNPLTYNLKPDHPLIALTRGGGRHIKSTPAKNYTLKEASRTYSFWVFNLTLAMFALYSTAYTFHVESLFSTVGMTKSDAISIFVPAGVISVGIQIVASWLSDYIKLRYLLLVEQIGLIASMLALSMLSPENKWIFIVGNGLMMGIFGVLTAITWPRFFGLKHLGAISGFALSWSVAGSAIGPYFFSKSLDLSGTYATGALICLGVTAILFVMGFWATNVNEQHNLQERKNNISEQKDEKD